MNEKHPMTMKDIARELGVSVSTVSRALNDSPSISRERREFIQQFARQHNFVANALAGQLRQSRTMVSRVIGVVVPEFDREFFACVLAGIEDEAATRGYRLMVACSAEDSAREVDICRSFTQNKVCGIIISQAKTTVNYGHFEKVTAAGLPLVFFDRICPGIDASRVVVDDYAGTYRAVSYLIEHGCRHIAYYGTDLNMEIAKNRFNGYKDALYKHGLKVIDELVRLCDTRAEAERVTPAMLRMSPRPDAFFAVNDETALGVIYTAKQLGYTIPGEVSVCGFSNSLLSTACDPQLTTIDQHGEQVGRQAAEMLIGIAEGRYDSTHAIKRVVKTELIARQTTRN